MGSEAIRKEIEDFQRSVKKVSSGVGKAEALWNDAKFSELSASVSEIANMSKDVIVTGQSCCSAIDRFDRIAAEKY